MQHRGIELDLQHRFQFAGKIGARAALKCVCRLSLCTDATCARRIRGKRFAAKEKPVEAGQVTVSQDALPWGGNAKAS
jgi:hypothetical protein